MRTLFIADLHLSEQEPAITAGFLRFLQREAYQADALYILGDFFEYWIGDDDPQPLHREIASALHDLTNSGVPCYFIHGNRDFLIGKRFAQECGMTLLPQEKRLSLYGHPILIMHGDTLCTDDVDYQRYRRKVNNPFIQKLFSWLPLRTRLNIAAKMRDRSQMTNDGKSEAIMDVNQQAVIEALERNQAEWLIHGHTHRPAIHNVDMPNGEQAKRAVLGAWHYQGSMISVTPEGIELIEFPF
ncbi:MULTISPECIES: UDP-2,3-diacylglucosamine diphosphatase [Hafnia]|uniref:UDP-2,3-diacylglucosamine hydrolase n=1 Tax=Hafnia alvei ATCC 51873 TaxID=1002364 RepID=G9Y6B4_HAFAL|nr:MULTISPECIES: UDP-2,3-diacylglucosamine diphosphatase [Hafnia]EHM42745.1 UDP-2,3-diacylglucosamine hydrolase [Hafnia alvei ATCC 51873]OFS09659.1 UDP-2,3-diacylglucosamine hydrolase [Hafnia sp. HMSC23F03]QQE41813.1 UDP-2,3-diacylglucosamine diphosphatase [Hafnia alvei]